MSGHFSSLIEGDSVVDDGVSAGDASTGRAPRIPVTVLTGFLGSGKTTLLNLLLRQPDLRGTAVIVNEFGTIGIDHDLIEQTGDDTVLLANGCVCCAVRGDLVDALDRLAQREGSGVEQVLIETSGLAEPGPIMRSLMAEPRLRHRFALSGVACTVDAVLSMGTLDRYPESVRQVAVADRLFVTKTDLPEADAHAIALATRLRQINPNAAVHAARTDQLAALQSLIEDTAPSRANAGEALPYRSMATAADASPIHRDGISSFTLVRDDALPRDAFFAWLDMVIAARGEDLLRVKGLVRLADDAERPLVIHGVQHLFEPPVVLPAWPSADRRTRIVFITRGIDGEALGETLDVLVRRHARRSRAD